MRSILLITLVSLLSLAGCSSDQSDFVSAGPSSKNFEADWSTAPEAFEVDGGTLAVPIDIGTEDLSYEFDAQSGRAVGRAVIRFRAEQAGFPMLKMGPELLGAKLDGKDLGAQAIRTVKAPGGGSVEVLQARASANQQHVLDVTFTLPADTYTIDGSGVRIGFWMDDNVGYFLDRYAPANFEFDQVRLSATLEVRNASATHQLFTNGTATRLAERKWRVDFPDYFTASSFYLHLSTAAFNIAHDQYRGMQRSVPITIYSNTTSDLASVMAQAKAAMSELESTFGPYSHSELLLYIAQPGGSLAGMEYAGAAMTHAAAVSHEISHSWFARGIMPANGNSGWIDEAIASWRDENYPRAESAPDRAAAMLSGFSGFALNTPSASYREGKTLMSELDYLAAASGGMRPVLRALYESLNHKVIDTETFFRFVRDRTGLALGPIFARYVYGGNPPSAIIGGTTDQSTRFPALNEIPEPARHVRFSEEQLRELR